MKALTTRQESILRFVLEYRAEHDCSPTIREIGQAFGIKPGAAHAHMKALVKKGVLVQEHWTGEWFRLSPRMLDQMGVLAEGMEDALKAFNALLEIPPKVCA